MYINNPEFLYNLLLHLNKDIRIWRNGHIQLRVIISKSGYYNYSLRDNEGYFEDIWTMSDGLDDVVFKTTEIKKLDIGSWVNIVLYDDLKKLL